MTTPDDSVALAAFRENIVLQALFEESRDAIYVLALDGRFLVANQALLDRLGFSRDELLSMNWLPTVDTANTAMVTEHFQRAAGGSTERFRATGARKDGSTFRADTLNTPLLGTDGTPVAVLGIARDVDALEDAVLAHESLEALFESTLNAISDGLFFVDNDWVFTYVNPRGEEIAQRTRDELIGTTIWEGFPLMLGSEFGIGYRRALAEQVKTVTREVYEPYGVVLESTAYPTSAGLAIYVRDVTDEERSREALAQNELHIASQAALLDSARDAIIVRGLDHRISYWNRAAADLYGWSADEAMDRSIRELLYAAPDDFDAATAQVLANGEWAGDIEQLARDGRVIVADCRWSLVRDVDGNPEAIFAVNTDVTARRRQEELALRAQRMESLGTLASGIAHDLNNVLTPLLMSVQMLAADETDPGKRATLAVIEASAKRGADMMRQVLGFARGVDGRRIHVDTARLAADIGAFCREALPKSISLSVDVEPGIWSAIGDPTQLLQVLVNLVANARDAMPGGGTLRISARNEDVASPFELRLPAAGRYVRLQVEDSGSGMPAAVVQKVFEPFFTTKGVGEGTGLGLATSIAIIRSHGGTMQVYSEDGTGSSFVIFLPAIAPETEHDPAAPTAVARGTGQTVLVVDDEPDIRLVARQALESYGYRVVVAGNGREALDYLTSVGGTDVVFSDITMPVMDGVTLLAQLNTQLPAVPVLLASGLTPTMPSSPDGTGPRAFLVKPYSAFELRRAIAALLT